MRLTKSNQESKKSGLSKNDYVIYVYKKGSIDMPLLCIVDEVIDNPINKYTIRSLETKEIFKIDESLKEYTFEHSKCILTIDEAKAQKLYKSIYDIAINEHKKGLPITVFEEKSQS